MGAIESGRIGPNRCRTREMSIICIAGGDMVEFADIYWFPVKGFWQAVLEPVLNLKSGTYTTLNFTEGSGSK